MGTFQGPLLAAVNSENRKATPQSTDLFTVNTCHEQKTKGVSLKTSELIFRTKSPSRVSLPGRFYKRADLGIFICNGLNSVVLAHVLQEADDNE